MELSLRPPFSRVGGKSKLAEQIIKLIPKHETYIEAFAGSGCIFFKKPLSSVNILNDIDKNIYDMMRDLAVVDKIDYEFSPETNATRENFVSLLAKTDITDPNERLYRNLFLNKNSFCANMIKMGYKNPASWKTSKMIYLKKYLKDYQFKLNSATIHNEDYRKIIGEYDKEDSFFYLDPPYSANLKYWNYGHPSITNKELVEVLKNIKGKFIMSYDDTAENEELFKDFYIIKTETLYQVKSKGNRVVKEILILNYPPPSLT
jgi:DNA adenine methylase